MIGRVSFPQWTNRITRGGWIRGFRRVKQFFRHGGRTRGNGKGNDEDWIGFKILVARN